MSNPKFTRRPNQGPNVLMRIGSGNWAAKDNHLTIGKGSGSHSDWIGRVQFHIPEPDDWPTNGRLVNALITVREDGGHQHEEFRGSSPRLWIKRLSEKPNYSLPDTADGYYTQSGTGDKYPGSNTAGTEVEFNVNGTETRSIAGMIEQMLPASIRKRDGSPGGNALWGHFQFRSSDEGSNSRSMILDKEIVVVIEIKVAVTPDAPLITEIIGQQVDEQGNVSPTGPTIVGSTDGRTLEVVFAFRGAAGDTCSKAELALYGVGATDATPGAVVRTTGSITPTAGGGTNVYRIKLTGIPLGTEGRFRVRTTSQKDIQGDWSSLDDDDSHVKLAVIPGAPLDIVFQPYVDSPHVLFSLNSPNPADYLTGGQAVVTLLPQGTLAWDSGMEDIGGVGIRRADLVYNGVPLADGQRVSYIVRTRNQDQAVGVYSAPREQTVYEAQPVTFSPSPGRLTTQTPTITLTFPLADGAWLWLVDPVDDDRILYSSGGTPLTNQTSRAFVIPAGILTWGQRFRAKGAYIPDGSTVYTDPSELVGYSIAALPTVVLSVPDAFNRRVQVEDIEWLRTVTDPDGAAIASIEQEVRQAATPQGSGPLVVLWTDPTATPLTTVPGGTVPFESAVDSRARATNDAATGPWSPWLTITAMQPPDVDLITPVDAAVVANPTQALDWSVTGYGGRTQASATVGIYDPAGTVLASLVVDTETGTDIPAYLLDDATAYGWDVTVTDTQNMVTTSARRTFTTLFAEPVPVTAVAAEADPDAGSVVVSWGEGAEPYVHNVEVSWLNDEGLPVRIDGGPESLLDGNAPFTGASLTHIGARLGDNEYFVAVSNGWRSSDPVSASATLTSPDFRESCVVDGQGNRVGLVATSAPVEHAGTIERQHPPGGQPRQITWGSEARRVPMGVHLVPSEDGELVSTLRGWMGTGAPVWVKLAAPYVLDPVWATLQSFPSIPLAGGGMTIDLDWLELGDPVHAILPPVVEAPPEGEGDIWAAPEEDDFGTFTIEAV